MWLLVFQIYDDSIVLHSVFTTARKCLEQTGRLPPQLGGKSESESESDTDDNEERKSRNQSFMTRCREWKIFRSENKKEPKDKRKSDD